MKSAGLIFDHSPHYIDHLAPYCALMGWPLIVCNEEIGQIVRTFYPQVTLVEMDFFQLDLPPCIVSCYPKPMIQAALGIFRPYQGKVIWLPHGLSDKGWKLPFFEALGQEDLLLVYGQRMRDVLHAKKITVPQQSVGNFRREFYLKNRLFYDSLAPKKRSILYAPTWEDAEENGTFWEAFPKLIEQIPPEKQLLIKVHPNTQKKYELRLEMLKNKAGRFEFLENFPPIYPILNQTDVYVGDMSSIGYDFLSFNRPLFFLRKEKTDPTKDPSAFLMQAGTQITLDEIPQIFYKTEPVNHGHIASYAFD